MRDFLIIIKDMKFISVDDFFEKKDILINNYNKLDPDNKELYKWYFFYQLSILKNPLKRMMWDFINGECENYMLENEYLKFCDNRNCLFKKKTN